MPDNARCTQSAIGERDYASANPRGTRALIKEEGNLRARKRFQKEVPRIWTLRVLSREETLNPSSARGSVHVRVPRAVVSREKGPRSLGKSGTMSGITRDIKREGARDEYVKRKVAQSSAQSTRETGAGVTRGDRKAGPEWTCARRRTCVPRRVVLSRVLPFLP